MLRDVLSAVPLLRVSGHAVNSTLVDVLKPFVFVAGSIILVAGSRTSVFYVLMSGEIDVCARTARVGVCASCGRGAGHDR
jgi:hypothetical protein